MVEVKVGFLEKKNKELRVANEQVEQKYQKWKTRCKLYQKPGDVNEKITFLEKILQDRDFQIFN